MLLVGTVPAADKQHLKAVQRKYCPPPSREFTGRSDILSLMDEHFSSDSNNEQLMLVLYGLGGSGKSEIMRRFVADSQVQTEVHPRRYARSLPTFERDVKFLFLILCSAFQRSCMSTRAPQPLLKSTSQTYPWRRRSETKRGTPSTGLFVLGTVGFSFLTMPTTLVWIYIHSFLHVRTEISSSLPAINDLKSMACRSRCRGCPRWMRKIYLYGVHALRIPRSPRQTG